MRLYVIRHGQSYNNARVDKTVPRQADDELTSVGLQQAQLVADHMTQNPDPFPVADAPPDDAISHRITHIAVSPTWRALQTAAPLAAATTIAPTIWQDLHEIGGAYIKQNNAEIGQAGRSRAEIAATFPTYILPDTLTDDGWWNRDYESREDGLERAKIVVERIRTFADENPEAVLALVTHQVFFTVMLKLFMSMPPLDPVYMTHYNASIGLLNFLPNGLLIVHYLNRTRHLPLNLLTT